MSGIKSPGMCEHGTLKYQECVHCPPMSQGKGPRELSVKFSPNGALDILSYEGVWRFYANFKGTFIERYAYDDAIKERDAWQAQADLHARVADGQGAELLTLTADLEALKVACETIKRDAKALHDGDNKRIQRLERALARAKEWIGHVLGPSINRGPLPAIEQLERGE